MPYDFICWRNEAYRCTGCGCFHSDEYCSRSPIASRGHMKYIMKTETMSDWDLHVYQDKVDRWFKLKEKEVMEMAKKKKGKGKGY